MAKLPLVRPWHGGLRKWIDHGCTAPCNNLGQYIRDWPLHLFERWFGHGSSIHCSDASWLMFANWRAAPTWTAWLPGRGRPPEAVARRAGLEPVEKVLTGAPTCCRPRR